MTNTHTGYIIGIENTHTGYLKVKCRNNDTWNTGGIDMFEADNKQEENAGICCHTKHTPRSAAQNKNLKNRLNRMIGQLNGIGRMLDENRYCGDILTQIAAIESALQGFGYIVLKEHLETCVVEEVLKGNDKIMDETIDLVRKLK